ncbi:MAG: hypothetical protein ACOYX1_02505 [Acidobacteriota bacterium]
MATSGEPQQSIQISDLSDASIKRIGEVMRTELTRQLPEASLGWFRSALALALGATFFAAGAMTGFIFAKTQSVDWKAIIGLVVVVGVLYGSIVSIGKFGDRFTA